MTSEIEQGEDSSAIPIKEIFPNMVMQGALKFLNLSRDTTTQPQVNIKNIFNYEDFFFTMDESNTNLK